MKPLGIPHGIASHSLYVQTITKNCTNHKVNPLFQVLSKFKAFMNPRLGNTALDEMQLLLMSF